MEDRRAHVTRWFAGYVPVMCKKATLLSITLSGALCVSTIRGQERWASMNGPWEAWDPVDMAVGYEGTLPSKSGLRPVEPITRPLVYTIGGPNRQLLVSGDEGDTWTHLPLTEVLAVVCLPDNPSVIYAARMNGSSCSVTKSTNGGGTWSDKLSLDRPVSRITLSPHNPLVLYLGLGGPVYDVNRPLWRSLDAGESWACVTSLDIYGKVTKVVFDRSDPAVAFVAARGTMSGVWKSTDAGVTWQQKNSGMSNTHITSLCATAAPYEHVLYAGAYDFGTSGPRIYKSTDRGEHWAEVWTNSGAADITVDPGQPNLVYAATNNGVLRSSDFGSSWSNSSRGIFNRDGLRIMPLRGESAKTRILLGTSAAFYRTDDNGGHWAEKTRGMAKVPCYGVAVNKAGIFSVAYGYRGGGSFVHRSLDGASWNVVEDNSLFNSASPFFGFDIALNPSDENVVLASGTRTDDIPQLLFRSSDGGVTWRNVYTSVFANQPSNIIFDPRNTHVVYSTDIHHVLKSTDGGVSWNRLPNSPAHVYALGIATTRERVSTTLYAAGSSKVQKSEDGGKTWYDVSSGLPCPVVSLVCDPVDSQVVFAGTNCDRVYRTTEGGRSWEPRRHGIYGGFIQSLIIHPSHRALYAVASDYSGAPTRVYRSTNLGETWRDISDGLAGVMVYDLALDNTDPGVIYAATDQGIYILRAAQTPPTASAVEKNEPPDFALEQNFPNPFNPTTKIKFSIPKSFHVSLKVFDILGKAVTSLVNEEKQAGTYEVDFDAGNLPSGIYFYRIQTRDYVETKKMMVMK